MDHPSDDTSHGLACIAFSALVAADAPLDDVELGRRAKLTPMALRSALRSLERSGAVTRGAGGWRIVVREPRAPTPCGGTRP